MDLAELWAIFGPGFSGAVFGTGWWFWVDAVVCSSIQVPFVHYLPGIFASLGALMFNCVRKEDIDYSPYDEGEWRLKLWLFHSVCRSIEAVAFHSVCRSICFLSCFCWLADSRFGCEDWAFNLDWCGWCLSMCICIDKVKLFYALFWLCIS
ncbi:T32E20.29 [Arabidopsis thaliana]|uniref:T32E20.29 n=1 Tax=Arabidopsis thaliana TaxID=3702 RepID=Q9LP91_ARATH|nr:T32E20.29 [Arabidopsis thaliana]